MPCQYGTVLAKREIRLVYSFCSILLYSVRFKALRNLEKSGCSDYAQYNLYSFAGINSFSW
jgi:hypothetical protein